MGNALFPSPPMQTAPGVPDCWVRLSPEQIKRIRESWKESLKKGDDYPGRSIYLRLFAKSQEINKIFEYGGTPTSTPSQSDYNERMQRQQKAFTQILDKIIKNLEKLSVMDDELRILGARHVRYHDRGFEPFLWDYFTEAMVEVGMDWESRAKKVDPVQFSETKEAWKQIVAYVIQKMKDGYYEAVIRKQKNEQEVLEAAQNITLDKVEAPAVAKE